MLRRISHLLVVPVALSLWGCPGDLQGQWPDAALPQCQGDIDVITEIFGRNCGTDACHEGPEPQEGLSLLESEDAVFAQMIGITANQCDGRILIDPTDVNGSFLLDKIRGRSAIPPGCGDQMPFGSRLNPNEISCVERWIRERLDGVDGGVGDAMVPDAGDAGIDDTGVDAPVVDAPMDIGADMGAADMGAPVDCTPVEADVNLALCETTPDTCAGEFLMGQGCPALCASAGLVCTASYENIGSGDCMFDMALPLDCDNALMHMADYCECGRP